MGQTLADKLFDQAGEIHFDLLKFFRRFVFPQALRQPFNGIEIPFGVIAAIDAIRLRMAQWQHIRGDSSRTPGIAQRNPVIRRDSVPQPRRSAAHRAAAMPVVQAVSPISCSECVRQTAFPRPTAFFGGLFSFGMPLPIAFNVLCLIFRVKAVPSSFPRVYLFGVRLRVFLARFAEDFRVIFGVSTFFLGKSRPIVNVVLPEIGLHVLLALGILPSTLVILAQACRVFSSLLTFAVQDFYALLGIALFSQHVVTFEAKRVSARRMAFEFFKIGVGFPIATGTTNATNGQGFVDHRILTHARSQDGCSQRGVSAAFSGATLDYCSIVPQMQEVG